MNQDTNTTKRLHHYRMEVFFHLRFSKKNKDQGTVYVRVTVDGKRAPEKSLNIKLSINDWDKAKQNVRPNNAQCQALNTRINQSRIDFDEAYNVIKRGNKPVTAKRIMAAVFSPNEDFEAFTVIAHKYIKEKALTLSQPSVRNQHKFLKCIEVYHTHKNIKRLYLNDYQRTDFVAMNEYFKTQYKDTYSAKISTFFKSVFNYALSQRWVIHNPLVGIKLARDEEYDTTHLTQAEVKQLATIDFSTFGLKPTTAKAMEEERDMFVFCCYTGMHHADYSAKQYEILEHNGRTWLKGHRIKTAKGSKSKPYELPLHPMAIDIIAKYGSIDTLPIRNNAQRNQNLKVVAAYAKLDMNLTTKIARKTLANYCLNDLKMRQESVASVLGHTSTKYVKHYAKITSNSIDQEMIFN